MTDCDDLTLLFQGGNGFMHEKQDIRCSTYLSGTEYAAVKACREKLGLSESAFLRLAALQIVSQQARQELLRDSFPNGSTDSVRS
jgi:hypothetical protein